MDEPLRTTAQAVRASLPCSIELPAGAGKTHLVAALTAIAVDAGERPLVLTHTNAGVDALRRWLRRFGVDSATIRVDTIASWSFNLVKHYPQLSGVTVPAEPDWSRSAEYYRGAASAVGADALKRVLQASYGFVIVDEYQDCVIEQHQLIAAIGISMPICIFGDPLQNIFNFGNNVTVSWTNDVLATWPALPVESWPWRWKGRNEALGRWLLYIRGNLSKGRSIDLEVAPLTWWRETTPQAPVQACLARASVTGSVVAIAQFPPTCQAVAARTNGAFGMMEELEGRFMSRFAAIVDGGNPKLIAPATLKFAKDCISNISSRLLDADVLARLNQGKTVSHLRRPGAEQQLTLLSGLLSDAPPAQVLGTLQAIGQIKGGRLYRREAWQDMLKALKIAAAGGDVTVSVALARLRNRARIVGRGAEQRVISRPLLIKGLEYDHAIVLNPERLKATELYVALSRGRDTLTVVSKNRYLRPAAP